MIVGYLISEAKRRRVRLDQINSQTCQISQRKRPLDPKFPQSQDRNDSVTPFKD